LSAFIIYGEDKGGKGAIMKNESKSKKPNGMKD
jgi:hypothetical protein